MFLLCSCSFCRIRFRFCLQGCSTWSSALVHISKHDVNVCFPASKSDHSDFIDWECCCITSDSNACFPDVQYASDQAGPLPYLYLSQYKESNPHISCCTNYGKETEKTNIHILLGQFCNVCFMLTGGDLVATNLSRAVETKYVVSSIHKRWALDRCHIIRKWSMQSVKVISDSEHFMVIHVQDIHKNANAHLVPLKKNSTWHFKN